MFLSFTTTVSAGDLQFLHDLGINLVILFHPDRANKILNSRLVFNIISVMGGVVLDNNNIRKLILSVSSSVKS